MRRAICQVSGFFFLHKDTESRLDLRVFLFEICSRSSCFIRVDTTRFSCYNIRITQLDLFEIVIMYHQLDSQLDLNLVENYHHYMSSYTSYNELDLDDTYARRDTSYEALAYRHHV